ncbi:hypothetical protein PGB34_17725 [Xenophilus arseniciresistens]|uniref:Transmembrane protein n=1 Tax=Xenophilus arseniciresistens TaxID=1283306 RepID=A0AAE3NBC0_9BURK|nr:hypothetical protein [Xenophilus arseniciresistens]MDA7418208.1 hypothetical protein [Xenophilus arseniciresistens]
MSGWRLALLLLGGVAYSAASYWMMLVHPAQPWAVPVLLVPLWLTGIGLAASRFGRWGAGAVVAAGLAFFALVWRGEAGDPNWLYMVQHVGINALLGAWFGSTLRAGQLSLIGQFAQRLHPLTPDHRRYTAAVTRVWTGYFAVVALLSALIYGLRPFAEWSLFSNLITPLGCAALFIGEHLMRYRLHPEFERTRLIDAVRAFYAHPAPGSAAPGDQSPRP